jgi:hypothetical protein
MDSLWLSINDGSEHHAFRQVVAKNGVDVIIQNLPCFLIINQAQILVHAVFFTPLVLDRSTMTRRVVNPSLVSLWAPP